jgi:hypothetical protein
MLERSAIGDVGVKHCHELGGLEGRWGPKIGIWYVLCHSAALGQ